jgi:dihydropteroate synthase
VMGIVNVTPDSFSDGGMFDDADAAVKHGLQLLEEGADILDVGGESTRPGSDPVDEDKELARVLPVIEGLRREAPEAILSVDTRKAAVASEALAAGTDVVNDIGAGADPGMFGVVASAGAGMVLMHMQGEPRTMQSEPRYGDVVGEVRSFLADRLGGAVAAGIGRDHLCIDPGIGFGKDLEHNLALLRSIGSFRELGVPVLVGVSRKRFVGELSGADDSAQRLEGSVAAAVWCASQGVEMLRVHDVGSTVRALRVVDAIARERP